MKKMKKLFILSGMLLFAGTLFLSSCSKDEDVKPGNPTMSFLVENGYISENTTASYNDTLRFMVYNVYNGTDMLTHFKASMNTFAVIDSTISEKNFTIEIIRNKNVEETEVWKFETTDNAGHTVNFSITITGDFGPIKSYTDILLGAQDNPTIESFVSYSNNTFTKYFQADAFNHQADIDMFCFFENTPDHPNMMTLAAPGSNITGIFTGATAPENYTMKNVTFYVQTTLTALEFDAVENDAKILSVFDPENKYKKANQLDAGDVVAFWLQSGKYGLLKVTDVQGTEDGTLEFDVKIQE
jgi:hypothetical protein